MKALHCLIALFLSCASLAQSEKNARIPLPTNEAILQITNLNVEGYNALFKALESDENFSIVTACIPAHVLHITWKNKSVSSDSEIKKFIASAERIGLSQIHHMTLWGVEEFEEECLKARISNTK
jgi:hypothetical protein